MPDDHLICSYAATLLEHFQGYIRGYPLGVSDRYVAFAEGLKGFRLLNKDLKG